MTANGRFGFGNRRNVSAPVKRNRSDVLLGQLTDINSSASTVGKKVMEILSLTSQSCSNFTFSRVSSAGKCKLAPALRYGHVSQTEASKPTEASKLARSLAVMLKASWCQRIKFAKFSCVTSTPFGAPVDPDV